MAWTSERSGGKFRGREKRLLLYLALVLAVAAWKFLPRPWTPAITLETEHYRIASTASREQTEHVGQVVEVLYAAYASRFSSLPTFQNQHPKLSLRLYKDRAEMRRVNPNLGWAEAFYRQPLCHAYYSAGEINPHQWLLHEVVHQLNEEVAHLKLERWLDEGVAEYFSTSQINENRLALGRIDYNTYPLWWLDLLATTPDLKANLGNGSVIPLRAILTGAGGPSLDREFNLYDLHWWTLAHFLFESEPHRGAVLELLREGGTLESFERLIGPLEQIEPAWHAHVRRIKTGHWQPNSARSARPSRRAARLK